MGFVPLNYRAGIRVRVSVFVLVVFTATLTDAITVHASLPDLFEQPREQIARFTFSFALREQLHRNPS